MTTKLDRMTVNLSAARAAWVRAKTAGGASLSAILDELVGDAMIREEVEARDEAARLAKTARTWARTTGGSRQGDLFRADDGETGAALSIGPASKPQQSVGGGPVDSGPWGRVKRFRAFHDLGVSMCVGGHC